MQKDLFAVINEGDVIIFDDFNKMRDWVSLMVTEFYGKDFDLDFFFSNGYSQLYDTITWTKRVAIFTN